MEQQQQEELRILGVSIWHYQPLNGKCITSFARSLPKVCSDGEEQRVTVQLEEQESELVFCQASKVEGGEEEALMEDCHCILVVFSVTDLHSLREAETLLQSLWQSGHLNTKAVIVVGNKIDLARAREVPIDGEIWVG